MMCGVAGDRLMQGNAVGLVQLLAQIEHIKPRLQYIRIIGIAREQSGTRFRGLRHLALA